MIGPPRPRGGGGPSAVGAACHACLGLIAPLRSEYQDHIIGDVTEVEISGGGCDVSSFKTSYSRVPLYGIERRADSMRRRPPCFAIALVLTLWAFAGLVTLTCACCALMGGTCPGVCASSPSVLSTPSHDTSVSVHVVYVQPPCPPASVVVQVPTPPPKALSVSA